MTSVYGTEVSPRSQSSITSKLRTCKVLGEEREAILTIFQGRHTFTLHVGRWLMLTDVSDTPLPASPHPRAVSNLIRNAVYRLPTSFRATAILNAFLLPTSTTSFLPRVTAV